MNTQPEDFQPSVCLKLTDTMQVGDVVISSIFTDSDDEQMIVEGWAGEPVEEIMQYSTAAVLRYFTFEPSVILPLDAVMEEGDVIVYPDFPIMVVDGLAGERVEDLGGTAVAVLRYENPDQKVKDHNNPVELPEGIEDAEEEMLGMLKALIGIEDNDPEVEEGVKVTNWVMETQTVSIKVGLHSVKDIMESTSGVDSNDLRTVFSCVAASVLLDYLKAHDLEFEP